jgi:hypothetical protein
VHGDFEGPLRAVLTQRSGPLYGAMMSLKGKTMSLIMNSPMIHNAVEWGRALPAMPGKVATFKVYFEGNRSRTTRCRCARRSMPGWCRSASASSIRTSPRSWRRRT